MRRILSTLALITLTATACGTSSTATPPPEPTNQPNARAETATAIPSPSPTPPPGIVVQRAPNGGADPITEALTAELQTLAAGSDLQFEAVGTDIPLESLPDPLALLVAYQPESELLEGLEAAGIGPGQVVAIAPGSDVSDQVSVIIGPDGLRADRAAFLAGYTAAVLSDNYRVGVVSVEGVSPAGASSGFTAGARYYCGLCRAAYPPFSDYPDSIRLPTEPGSSEADSAVQQLEDVGVRTVYLAPGLELGPLPAALAEAGISLLARQRPEGYPDELWLAAVRPAPELVLSNNWQSVLSGQAPAEFAMPLTVTDRNSRAFTDARYRLVDEVLQDLAAGRIDTGVAAP